MLILSRRVGETLKIDNEISLTVLSVKGNQVRLGIDAPDDVAIHREEVFLRIRTDSESKTEKHFRGNSRA